MTTVAELAAAAIQGLQDAYNTKVKTLITPVYNVVGYGAKGDGTTNDIEAIQAAIDDAKETVETLLSDKISTVKASVYIPAGTYNIDGELKVYSGILLFGAGQGQTTLKYTGTGGNAISINKVDTEEIYAVQFRDFVLWNQGTGVRGISGDDGSPLAIRACGLFNVTVYGFDKNVYLDNSWAFAIENSVLADANNYNLHIKNATNFYAKHTRFDMAGDDSVLIEDSSTGGESVAPLFINCTFQSADKWGVHGIDVLNATLINCFFEANNQNATADYGCVYFEDGTNNRGRYFQILGGFFSPGTGTSGQTGIKIDRAQNVYINTHMRGSDIATGVSLGSNVDTAYVIGAYPAGSTPVSSSATFLFKQINGGQFEVYGPNNSIDVGSFDANNAQFKIGEDAGGQIVIGESAGLGAFQGVGSGTDYDLSIQPYAGFARMGAVAWRTILTGSHYNTGDSTRNRGVANIGIDTSDGNRIVTFASDQISVAGAMWFVWKQTSESTNSLTIATEGSETVNGASEYSTTNGDAFLIVWSDGNNLRVKEI